MHTTDIHGRPWQSCPGCPHPTPGSCASRRHRAYCAHLASQPEIWGPIIAAEPAEDRPPRPGPPPPPPPFAPRAGRPGQIRLGLVVPNLAPGGVERWAQTLAGSLDPARYRTVGVVAAYEDFADPAVVGWFPARGIPVGYGADAARALAAGSDILIGSGAAALGEWLGEGGWPCAVVAVSHGTCDWARASVAWSGRAAARVGVSTAAAEMFGGDGPPARVIENIPHAGAPRRSRAEVRAQWGIPESAKVLGYIGRWAREKRPEAVLEALGHLPPEWFGVAVGPYQERAVVPDGLTGRFVLAGPSDDVGGDLAALDALMLASSSEGFSLVLAEALTAGVPVVATPVGCLRDRPELARIIPVGAPGPAIAAAVLADAADPAGMADRVERGRRFAHEHLTVGRFVREWDALLSGLVASVRPPEPRTAPEPAPPSRTPQRTRKRPARPRPTDAEMRDQWADQMYAARCEHRSKDNVCCGHVRCRREDPFGVVLSASDCVACAARLRRGEPAPARMGPAVRA